MRLPWDRWKRPDASGGAFPAQGAAWLLAAFFLGACSPSAPKAAAPQPLPGEVLSQGQGIYEQLCATCHFDGHGSPTAPALIDSAIVKNSPDEMIGSILHGRNGPMNVNGQIVNGIMPAQNTLSDEDIAAVVTYVRHEFGKADQLTTPAEVAARR